MAAGPEGEAPSAYSAGNQPGYSASQVAYVNGDVQQWLQLPGESARERYELGLRYLDAGAAHRAARLITSVAEDLAGDSDYSVNHVAYHQILAILSGRFYDELPRADLNAIDEARARSSRDVPDHGRWLLAVESIGKLLDCLKAERTADIGTALDPILRQIEALPHDRAEEVRRHLDPLLTSAGEDQRRAAPPAQLTERRMRGDRKDWAWTFFEPDPHEPTRRVVHKPQLTTPERICAAIFGVLAVVSAIATIALLQTGGAVRAALIAVILLLSGCVAIASGVSYQAARERLGEKEYEHGLKQHFSRYTAPAPEVGEVDVLEELHFDQADPESARMMRKRRRQFIDAATKLIDDQLARYAPQPLSRRQIWQAETAGIRRSLREEIIRQYGDLDLRPGAMNWLISWRLKEVARSWNARKLHHFRETMQPHPVAVLGRGVGLATFAVTAVYALIVMLRLRPEDAVIAAGLGAIAIIPVLTGRLDVHVVQRYKFIADLRDSGRKFEAEQDEFTRWRRQLIDRPDDHEVACWLDYDKICLKKLAMDQLGLTHRDAVRYVVLTEPAAGSIRMRSPLVSRYSAYRLTVILLAENGVRLLSATLDFCTGDIFDQERRSFRHDMIASATMVEKGIAFDSGREHPMRPGSNRARRLDPPGAGGQAAVAWAKAGAPILRQDFLLRLTNGEDINFLTESSDADVAVLGIKDPGMLLDLALDTSGISDALELLEMITGHGAAWVYKRRGQ